MQNSNITIIGTSHISKDSINEVRNAVKSLNPDIIAIELDMLRFKSLTSKQQKRSIWNTIRTFGIKGLILNLIGSYIENSLGKKVGISPGSEMKEAIKLAKENNKQIMLIDQDIRITMKNLTKEVKFKEKLRIFLDILTAMFHKKKAEKELYSMDLTKVPSQELIEKLLEEVKKRYPGVYKTLIEDRNTVLAKNLYKIRNAYKESKILAIMGAGHKKEVDALISRWD